MSYLIVAASGGAKKLDERAFDLVLGGKTKSEAEDKARWEAFAIRTEIEADTASGAGDGI